MWVVLVHLAHSPRRARPLCGALGGQNPAGGLTCGDRVRSRMPDPELSLGPHPPPLTPPGFSQVTRRDHMQLLSPQQGRRAVLFKSDFKFRPAGPGVLFTPHGAAPELVFNTASWDLRASAGFCVIFTLVRLHPRLAAATRSVVIPPPRCQGLSSLGRVPRHHRLPGPPGTELGPLLGTEPHGPQRARL